MTTALARIEPADVVPVRTVVEATLAVALAEVDRPDARWALCVERWLLGYASPGTRAAYRRDVEQWRAFVTGLGCDPLAAGRSHVAAWQRVLAETSAPATVARRVSALAALYGYLVDEDVIARSPVRGRRPRGTTESTSTGATEREAARLLDAAAADGPRSSVLIGLLYLLGLRVSEALGATVEDLGHERGHRTLTITRKGGQRQRMPLPPDLAHDVEVLLDGRGAGPILATVTGRPMDRQAAWRTVRRLGREAGLPQAATLHPHDLRHAHATAALDAGVPLRDVQDSLGHADPRTTRRYDRARARLDRHPGTLLAGRLAQYRDEDAAVG